MVYSRDPALPAPKDRCDANPAIASRARVRTIPVPGFYPAPSMSRP
jgi:hypothetical protein